MLDTRSHERPTYAKRLLQPFAEILQSHDVLGERVREMVESEGDRVLVDVAHRALTAVVDFTGDVDLGLKASRRLVRGDAGGVDYVVSSAPTVRCAIERAGRYTRLVNDILDVRLELQGASAVVVLDNRTVLPRAAADFEVGGFYRNHVKEWLDDRLAELTVWFTHSAPADCREYELTFAPSRVRFNAPALGFTFDRHLLDLPLKGADPNLQKVLVPYANEKLSRLPSARTVTAEVRALLSEQLFAGPPDVANVASRTGMSTRTLARRLEQEGTSFRGLVDDTRRTLALAHVGESDLAFSEIAYRLGFSHTAAFHRAFRRWTRATPLKYRRSRGR